MSKILELLSLRPSAASVDYVTDKAQFHLYRLLTEQRHPNTWDLSFVVEHDVAAGLRQILSVDDDLQRRIDELAAAPEVLERMVTEFATALGEGRRIYFYGCGATGRLAKQMESSFWRPFWRRLRERGVAGALPDDMEGRLTGEMTGADRALVSSLEGFEDLQLVGALQLQDHGIERGDVVVCVTEGGETSSVIGTALAAREQYGTDESEAAKRRVYFVYNNPDDVLRPYDRSRAVLDAPGITKLCLATGPQAITGSTRMQATTIETFVLGVVLETAVERLVAEHVDTDTLRALGFAPDRPLAERLRTGFADLREAVAAAVPRLAELTGLESDTYRREGFSTYLAESAMVTVFTDCTERSPTFRLYPLDRVDEPERKCMVQIWTDAADAPTAWRAFLGRPFRGLDSAFYRQPLAEQVDDAYLNRAALESLAKAGADQEPLYDFSFSPANVERRGPAAGDLGVMVLVDDECQSSVAERFAKMCHERGARLAVVRAGEFEATAAPEADIVVDLPLAAAGDPLRVRGHVAVKVALNAHSTAALARNGRVIGNTMTNVSPSNLKLFGRATFLVKSWVDDVVAQPAWVAEHGATEAVSFADANAVVFDAMDWVATQPPGQTAEVALSIVRILESLRQARAIDWQQARAIVDGEGLAAYLRRLHPALR